MSLFWRFECGQRKCGFRVDVGFQSEFPGLKLAYCTRCFRQVLLDQIGPDEPGFMDDVWVYRILNGLDEPPRPPRLTPRQKRLLRQAPPLVEPSAAPIDHFAAFRTRFRLSGHHLFQTRSGDLAEGVEQGPCPHCGIPNSISLGPGAEELQCPKCGQGELHGEYFE